jgi:hypothetical protein
VKKIIIASALALALANAHAGITDLNFVFVGDPALNCVFNPSCTITVVDSTSPVLFPGFPTNPSPFFLQSRTFDGVKGAPASGLYGYEYRIDLDLPPGTKVPDECLFSLTVDFGPIVPLDYDGSGVKNPVYVITTGAVGNIEPDAVVQNGSQVTFVWAAEADTGLISQLCLGSDSFFIGLASTQPPIFSNAALDTNGGAQFGIGPQIVGDRQPQTDPFSVIDNILHLVSDIPLRDFAGTNDPIRHVSHHLVESLLRDSQDLIALGDPETADELLNVLLGKVNGLEGSWVQNDPNGKDWQTLLYENVATIINLLQPDSPVPMIPSSPVRPD